MDLRQYIRDVPDFPQKGVIFKDITPLLQNPVAFRSTIDMLDKQYRHRRVDDIVAIESRGFIFGAPLAERLGAAFVPVRKKGKLPYKTVGVEYGLEYGTAAVEVHADGILPGRRYVIIDDVLATGGTAAAARELVHRLGGEVVGLGCIIELEFLKGREKLDGLDVFSILKY